jgi:hypothetical protein
MPSDPLDAGTSLLRKLKLGSIPTEGTNSPHIYFLDWRSLVGRCALAALVLVVERFLGKEEA